MERSTTTSSGSSQASPVVSPPPPPTIFVQAEPHTFRDLVQKHTGAPAGDVPDKLPVTAPPAARSAVGPRCRPAFKLQDRRPSVRKLEIKLGLTSLHHHHHHHHLQGHPSPSPRSPPQYLVFAAAGGPNQKAAPFPSPVTPLGSGPLFSPGVSEEERAIAERGFYLHPSPRGTPRGSDPPPELLPLFPLTSPKVVPRLAGHDGDADPDGQRKHL